jgi:hypothetical protein
MQGNMPTNERSSPDTCRLFVEMIKSLSPDHGVIDQIFLSVETIRERIDQAYNRICMDLPEINLEIHQTFQQASGTLDSLYAHGEIGVIENVVGDMEGSIRNLAFLIKPMRSHDVQVLETIELSYPNMESLLSMFEGSSICQDPDHDAGSLALKLAIERDNLVGIIQDALELENSLIEEAASIITDDARSVRCTLSSAIMILKDLVSRSNSMKEPILKIMSGLQAHDIVNQDITAISYGLQKMRSLRDIPGNRDDIMDAVLFQEQASSLSRDLISQLIKVLRKHGRELGREIGRIEDMVSRIKEDKDAVGEFLLMNRNGRSTFDLVISEVSAVFANIARKLDALRHLKESQQVQTDRLISLCDEFDQRISSGASLGGHREMLEAMSKTTFLFKSLAKMIKYGYGSLDLEEISERFAHEANAVKHELEEIKDLLMGTIRGIDTCAGRCTDAIKRFRADIDKLMMILDGNENIFDGLSSFAHSMGSMRDDISRQMSLDRREIFTQEFKDILSRLRNPHSNSLAAGEDHGLEDGLVLF